ncbi:ATP-binding cassette domain-containing protein [Chryseolinea lacunae]|uniref:ATP-binding cassette domain-containing protein n=1 Tax=Chryseolinea lacunae TaxID=2801331 RepID=A0ABS1KP34_9BACT|nr:ATP-binding cassette domain-containing protein [Chryseolinea lacunae]MBL0741210.1 ATP-binding cassette domain-containing protein [Chryseolinea lacunae]
MIEIKHADIIKSGERLFDNFSWTINAGEHWVITGANGSGKTLLLELLAGKVHLPKGELHMDFIAGNTWDERHAERKRKIHYIPTHALQAFLANTPNLFYQQRYYTLNESETTPTVRSILGKEADQLEALNIPPSLSIAHLLDVEVTRLSNGQLKKVLFCKSILSEIPKVLLLDYPFEGLDPQSRNDLCAFLDFIATTYGIQIIMVDHYHQLPTVINRRLVLEKFGVKKTEIVSAQSEMELPLATTTTSIIEESNGEPVIAIRDLKIQYGEKVILEHFNWHVNRGERWALVGRNGAGKTTLFSMIFADHPMAYTQNISLFGRRRGSGESIWDIKRRINYLGPELINYLSPKSIPQSGRWYITNQNRNAPGEKLQTLVDYFDAGHYIDKPVNVFSSGQLQMLLMMSCFLTEKELILLDEPFQFLDLEQRGRITSFLQSQLHADTTLILITHDAQDIAEWAAHTLRL